MSDGMRRELVYLSSHATNRYFIPNWGICLDVFQYISLNKLEKAIANLARLTNDTIVVSWNDDFENKYNDNKYEYVFNKLGFVKDVFVTAYFKHYLKYKKTIRVFRCRKEVHS